MNVPPIAATALFSESLQRWFATTFPAPTKVQREGWPLLARGDHALLLAPTGSGKTLAAFLAAIDRCTRLDPVEGGGVRVLYVSPMKALAHDIERNLRTPIDGIERAAMETGESLRRPRVSLRTGDTPAAERRAFRRDPPDILVTTPESLFLLLTSGAREQLRRVETVIIDELHVLVPSKRGAHLALSLERLSVLGERDPQRIGLSATARPIETVARFLGGDRPVRIVDASEPPRLEIRIEVPWRVEEGEADLLESGRTAAAAVEADLPGGGRVASGASRLSACASIVKQMEVGPTRREEIEVEARREPGSERARVGVWPALEARLVDGLFGVGSTIVFVNSRGLCERLASRLDELCRWWSARTTGCDPETLPPMVLAHHGSLARERRREIEQALEGGRLLAVVATSSLELGIDMASVEHVVLIGSPGSVTTGLQRLGRAGHAVGEISRGTLLPKHASEILEASVIVERMRRGEVEMLAIVNNSLDVLAQQLVAMVAMDEWEVDALATLLRRAASFRALSKEALLSVLDLLSGRWPSTDFADLRARIDFDRLTGRLRARPGALRLAIANVGTIPDRGLWPVHLGLGGPRIGELDEEMVYETRPGQVVVLGASSWRVLDIGRDSVVVEPVPGEPGRLPFWRGEGQGRPIGLGRAMGALLRELDGLDEGRMRARLAQGSSLDPAAVQGLASWLAEQRRSTGVLPSDDTVVVERFHDELGDWRLAILSPFGSRVHAPWALALEGVLAAGQGFEVQAVWGNDGLLLRFAGAAETPALGSLLPRADAIEALLVERLATTALFAGVFRENAARALLLPRRAPGRRTPLWVQRLKAQNLLGVARHHPSFPIVLETYRTCLQEIFDLEALRLLLVGIETGQVRVVEVETSRPSPFARALVLSLEAGRMYAGDTPLAEARAQALTLDRDLLRELLGTSDLRNLLDPAAIAETIAVLQQLSPDRRARSAEGVHDLLRALGALDTAAVQARCDCDMAGDWLEVLAKSARALRIEVAGREVWIAAEEAGLWRDALVGDSAMASSQLADTRATEVHVRGKVQPGSGFAGPRAAGVPVEFFESVADAPAQVLRRWARRTGPFTLADIERELGFTAADSGRLLHQLEAEGQLERGGFLPVEAALQAAAAVPAEEWIDREVLRRIRARTLASLRAEIAPVDAVAFQRFACSWHGLELGNEGRSGFDAAILALEGLPLSFRDLEARMLPARVRDYRPADLDRRIAGGELVWVGSGRLSRDDGRIILCRRERAGLLLDEVDESAVDAGGVEGGILRVLRDRGACFFNDLQLELAAVPLRALRQALWSLVWAGFVTNDGCEPLRRLGAASSSRRMGAGGGVIAGRWSRVAQLRPHEPDPTRASHAVALGLLERHGIVARAMLASESVVGGFARVYPVLRLMEEQGRLRRGHFVDGLEGAQFALPGVVERLRALRSPQPGGQPMVLAATDPALLFGSVLPWPALVEESQRDLLRRVVGARVVLLDGQPMIYAASAGRLLLTFPEMNDGTRALAVARALGEASSGSARRKWCTTAIDGRPAGTHGYAKILEAAGFAADHRGLRLW